MPFHSVLMAVRGVFLMFFYKNTNIRISRLEKINKPEYLFKLTHSAIDVEIGGGNVVELFGICCVQNFPNIYLLR